MPIHSLASLKEDVTTSQIVVGASTFLLLFGVKLWAPPTPTILSLMHHLLHLPSPPQILFLPPVASPLPESLLTLLHTIRLSAARNPMAQLHCEPLPKNPPAIKEFTKQWSTVPYGTAGEGGRRIDAIVLGEGWEVDASPKAKFNVDDKTATTTWDVNQFHFHFITSLLPSLLKVPPERNIRIVSLVSPTWSSAVPSLHGKPLKARSIIQASGANALRTLLLMTHFQLILDTLASSIYSVKKPVPDPEEGKPLRKKRDEKIQSNIMGISVIMGWTRDEIARRLVISWGWGMLWMILYPLVLILTPSPARSIQSILFALQAPVRYGPIDDLPSVVQGKEKVDERRSAVRGGEVVRDCAVVDVPPVLSSPMLARETYETIEKEVETGVKESNAREKMGSTKKD
ncbi:hypothetical protein P7C73_g2660, partial [Tremellales sp. Uapishka_1]